MKVAFFYECRFRNDGPPLYLKTAAVNNKSILKLDDVVHVVQDFDVERQGVADFNIWVDHGEDALPIKKFVCPKPNAYWCSDSHLGLDYRLEKAKEFDLVFVAISDHVELFRKHLGHDRVFWLPHAGEPTAYYPHPAVRKYDVCFIGHLPTRERVEYLDHLFRNFPNFWYGQRFFEEAARIYSLSNVAINKSVAKEANMRAFEVPLTKTCLVTDRSDDLCRLGFVDGINCQMYDSKEEMVDKVTELLQNKDLRENMAERGYKLVLDNHTYLHRIQRLLDIAEQYKLITREG